MTASPFRSSSPTWPSLAMVLATESSETLTARAYGLRRLLHWLTGLQPVSVAVARRPAEYPRRHRRWHVHRFLRQCGWGGESGKRDAAVCGELPERLGAEHGVLRWSQLYDTMR